MMFFPEIQGSFGDVNNNTNGTNQRRSGGGRGFASMDPQRVSEIASMGGKAAHKQGVAHEWTTDEARRAGRKGGQSGRGMHRAQPAAGGTLVTGGSS